MKILITGICGFVGSTLAKAWLSVPGVIVCGLDNLSRSGSENNRNELIKEGIKIYHGDIRVSSDFEEIPAVDWVIDAAANPSVMAGIDGRTSSRQLIEHNLIGTINILEYCKRHRAGFILISTSRVYSIKPLSEVRVEVVNQEFILKTNQSLPAGLSENGVSELFSTEPPISLYGSTKITSEILALEYGATFGFPVWINRCGVLAGAGQFGKADQGIFAYWINAYLRRQPLTYIGFGGNGCQVRDCLHPRDLLPLLREQITENGGQKARVINIGGGASHAISLAGLSNWCAQRFGFREINSEPVMRQYDIPWMVMDSKLAKETWDWQPQTSINQILEEIACHAERHPNWLEISRI